MRLKEQEASAAIGGYEFEPLRYPDGTVPREACLEVGAPLLAAMWNAIRQFEPDYLFAPPIPGDPLAGVHVDHVAVAQAVRSVAYMINVPHAFTPEFPADERTSVPTKTPVILNVHDTYMAGANAFDLAVDVEEVFESIARMSFCHQSQIAEWLPWVGRHAMSPPRSLDEWMHTLRARFMRRNREMGVSSTRVHEFFTVTAWGVVPSLEQLLSDFPSVSESFSNLPALRQKLARWRGE